MKPSIRKKYDPSMLIKYFLIFFGAIMIYNIISVNHFERWEVNSYTYTFHLPDISFGFASKLIVGYIYHIFFKDVLPEQVRIYEEVLLIVFYVFIAFMMARFVSLQEERSTRRAMTVLSLFYLTGPCTFSIYSYYLGMLDVYFVFFAALFVLFVKNKYLKYVTPILYLLTLAVHYSVILVYILLYIFIMLYEAHTNEKKSARIAYWVLLIISVIATLALTFYFVKYESKNLTYNTSESFQAQISKRYHYDKNPYFIYYDYAFFHYYPAFDSDDNVFLTYPITEIFPHIGDKLPSFIAGGIESVYSQMKLNKYFFDETHFLFAQITVLILAILPVLVMLIMFWVHRAKNERNKLMKWLYRFLVIQFFFSSILSFFFSIDISRWFSHALVVNFTFALYIMHKEKDEVEWFKNKILSIRPEFIVTYYFLYFFTFVSPYQ